MQVGIKPLTSAETLHTDEELEENTLLVHLNDNENHWSGTGTGFLLRARRKLLSKINKRIL